MSDLGKRVILPRSLHSPVERSRVEGSEEARRSPLHKVFGVGDFCGDPKASRQCVRAFRSERLPLDWRTRGLFGSGIYHHVRPFRPRSTIHWLAIVIALAERLKDWQSARVHGGRLGPLGMATGCPGFQEPIKRMAF
jgi:hypothetical protein